MKRILSFAVCLLLLFSTTSRAADDYGPGFTATTTDIFIARPFTFVASIIGGALWTVALPITIPTHTTEGALDSLVKHPWQLTFDRPLGDYGD